MSATPRHPHERLFAELTSGMTAAGARVRHDLGPQARAQNSQADRFEWIPDGIEVVERPFQIPWAVTPADQASDFLVSIYGASYWRVLELHSLLVGWLDLLIGPEQGCAPSDDAAPAILTGTVDLAALSYPYAGLVGLHLDVTSPLARALAFPGSPLASPQAIVDAVNVAANAVPMAVHARLSRVGGAAYLRLYSETDPLGIAGAVLTLDPTVSGSACGLLGFSTGSGNLSATGTPATSPYRPGYRVSESKPGPRGGDAAAVTWGAVVPVRLYTPIRSMQFLVGTIQTVPIAVTATDGSDAGDTITNP